MAVASFQAESNQVPQCGAKVHGAVIQEQSQIGGYLVDLLDHLLGHPDSNLFHAPPLGLLCPYQRNTLYHTVMAFVKRLLDINVLNNS